jgi:hypothetical protein
MIIFQRIFILLGVLMIFSSCNSTSLDYYQGTTPNGDIKAFFNGPIKAWGIIQDWRGRVISRFDVEMVGSWEGNKGTLIEHFNYYNGETQKRIWTIHQLDNGTFEGTASDIVGTATGNAVGSAIRWNYLMDLPIDGRTYRIRFDDWMWAMNDDVLINRSYLKKFGITVAELTLFMQKKK